MIRIVVVVTFLSGFCCSKILNDNVFGLIDKKTDDSKFELLLKKNDAKFEKFQENFDLLNRQLFQMNEKLFQMNEKFYQMNEKFYQMNEKIDQMDKKFDRKLERLSCQQQKFQFTLEEIKQRVQALEGRRFIAWIADRTKDFARLGKKSLVDHRMRNVEKSYEKSLNEEKKYKKSIISFRYH
jgi:transcriptional regulator with PAS, ATPase and Fis domain